MAEFSQNLEGDLNIQCEDLSKSQMAKIQPNPCQDTSSLEIWKDKKDLKVRKMPHGLCGLSSESVNRFLIWEREGQEEVVQHFWNAEGTSVNRELYIPFSNERKTTFSDEG